MPNGGAEVRFACPECGERLAIQPPAVELLTLRRCGSCGFQANASEFLTEDGVRQLARSEPQQAARLAYSFADRAKTPQTAEFWKEVAKSLGKR